MLPKPPNRTEINAQDARTRFLELLKLVQVGQRFTITHRGKAIADLLPSKAARPADAAAAIERFQAFIRENPVAARGIDWRALIDEGSA